MERIAKLNNVPTADLVPTLVLIEIPDENDGESEALGRSQPSSDNEAEEKVDVSNLYGSRLLRYIIADIKRQGLASMVLPVVVTRKRIEASSSMMSTPTQSARNSRSKPSKTIATEAALMQLPQGQESVAKYVNFGAVDALENPIQPHALPSLAIHVYRVQKQFLQCGKNLSAPTLKQQRSWAGVHTPQPFAYLREVMVSDLAGQICGTIVERPLDPLTINISDGREQVVMDAIASWGFSAHGLSDDELLYAAVIMVEHALQLPGLDEFRITTGMFKSRL